jgi:hypothetical protein
VGDEMAKIVVLEQLLKEWDTRARKAAAHAQRHDVRFRNLFPAEEPAARPFRCARSLRRGRGGGHSMKHRLP